MNTEKSINKDRSSTEKSILEQLKVLAKVALIEFDNLNKNDFPYAFFFCIPPEGNFVYPLIMSENQLEKIAQFYVDRGYKTFNDSSLKMMKVAFRWNTGEDWFIPKNNLSERVNQIIIQAIKEGEIELFDGQTEKLCMEALLELDEEDFFLQKNSRLVLGLTYRCESSEEFINWIQQLNPVNIVQQVEIENREMYETQDMIISPD
jgi:Domain of unknown function (DUF4303)